MPSKKQEGGEKNRLRRLSIISAATISVITFRKDKLSAQDDYLEEVEQTYSVAWLKRKCARFAQEWERVKAELNATFNARGKNVALECLQFGGNHEFWDDFPDEKSRHISRGATLLLLKQSVISKRTRTLSAH